MLISLPIVCLFIYLNPTYSLTDIPLSINETDNRIIDYTSTNVTLTNPSQTVLKEEENGDNWIDDDDDEDDNDNDSDNDNDNDNDNDDEGEWDSNDNRPPHENIDYPSRPLLEQIPIDIDPALPPHGHRPNKPHQHQPKPSHQPNQVHQPNHHHGHHHHPHRPHRKGICSFSRIENEIGVLRIGNRYSNDYSGFALKRGKFCNRGEYCPYACIEGYYSSQYIIQQKHDLKIIKPGLYCNRNSKLEKGLNLPLCLKGYNNVYLRSNQNNLLCKAVYPGNLDTLIPIPLDYKVKSLTTIPFNIDYNTFSLYYLNLPQFNEKCEWGTKYKPNGSYAPYIIKIAEKNDGLIEFILKWNIKFIENNMKSKYYPYLLDINVACLNPNNNNRAYCNSRLCTFTRDSNNDYVCKLLLPKYLKLVIDLKSNYNLLYGKNNTSN